MSHLIGYNLGALHKASRELNGKIGTVYYPSAPTIDKNPSIPSPRTFDFLDNWHQDNLPTPTQCAVHLELLEVFHALRIRILDSKSLDKVFDLGGPTKKVYRPRFIKGLGKWVNEEITLRDTTWEKNQDKKWTFYLGEAAKRFIVWANDFNSSLASGGKKHGIDDSNGGILMTEDSFLPPVDVLMVWHAFLLNPIDFLEYCQTNSLNYLPRVNFPWTLIHKSIWAHGPIRDTWKYDSDTWKVPKGGSVYTGILLHSIIKEGNKKGLSLKKVSHSTIVVKLMDNVERQRVFVKKMNANLWIRSPALQGTLQRAVGRYENYLELFRLYPGKMLVPTLDIDLVWHTSQLSPAAYETSVKARCGRFINHDDKIAKYKLAAGSDETQALYRTHFGLEYHACLCWECQAIMSAVEDSERHGSLDEQRSSTFAEDLADKLLADVEYHRAVESARRRNHVKLPVRENIS
ncbi:hypothetical protein FAUST_2829 [Fusarium austroamericanum]|uniref:Glycine-rich domain-containing protein 1 n=1 Tax=Fusarium austroamericanum TaxID=282268 RepID=A0AAN6C667_FUSAU|nr:hypothetical protein FAUST_2829 [Fusarium austroamericanum]